MVPGLKSTPNDMSTALNAAEAAARAAIAARTAPLKPRAKGVSADLVTDADAAAEAAAVAVIRAHCPDDAILGEEGAQRAGSSARRWLIDGIDGTVAFASGHPGGWCSAVALEDERGPVASAVHDPLGDRFAAARGEGATRNGERIELRAPRPLHDAHVAAFFRQDRLVAPGVRASAHALLDRTGLLRHAGPGSLELAWVAAGRLDAWIQPEVDPWDWLPGALLVTEAGGVARVVEAGTRWHVAGPSTVVDALVQLLT
jgi:myo-inositol-1(or 4)-monophosphatase